MIEVFLVHRYRLLAEAIVGSLAASGKVSCVGSADNRLAAMRRLRELETDVVLIDASLGRREVCDTIREIKAVLPELNVVFLGDEHGKELVDFIEAGASGYVPREASLEEMLDIIVAVDRGQTPCSPQVAASVLARIEELVGQRPQRSARKLGHAAQLTPREGEVLRLVAAGLRNKEIASRLGIKLPTVKNHVHKILDKFQVKQRREAIRIAFENGLLDDPLPRPSFSGLEG